MSTGVLQRIRWMFSPKGFRGSVLTLLSGAVVAMGVSFLLQPVLTRLYTPAEFGIANYFVAVMSLLITFTSLRYEDALMLPEDESDAANVAWLSLLLLCFFVVLTVFILPWRVPIAAALNMPGLAPWIVLIAPTLLFMRMARILEVWFSRSKQFRLITSGQVANSLSMTGSRILYGIPGIQAGAGGLISGFLTGHVVASILYGMALLRHNSRSLLSHFNLRRIYGLAIRYRRFSLYSTPAAFLNTFVARLPLLFLPFFFDETVLGFFGLATNVIAVPMSLIGGAVAQVFFVHAAEASRTGQITTLTHTIYSRLIGVSLFPVLAVAVTGPDLFAFVFGESWRPAGQYIRFLAPWLFFAALASPLTRLFDVLERQQADLLTSVFMFAGLSIALIVGGRTEDIGVTLLLLGSTGTLIRVLHLAIMLRLAKIPFLDALKPFWRYGILSLVPLLVVLFTTQYNLSWLTAMVAGVAILLYFVLLTWRDGILSPS